MTFPLYDVKGYKEPLRISPEHAAVIGATKHVPAAAEGDGPKPGTKAALIAQAEDLGLSTDGTKDELAARIAEAVGATPEA